MIRPRVGDFVYTDHELSTMLEDIRIFKEENVAGTVFGVLHPAGTIDVERTRVYAPSPPWRAVYTHRDSLVKAAKPLQGLHKVIMITLRFPHEE